MEFTALHRALGMQPGPLTSDLLDAAIEMGVRETDDIDWKQELPAPADLARSDFRKDIAAMANSGGGVIVYGVAEVEKAATGRTKIGPNFDEAYERTMRAVAVSQVHPPLMNLGVHLLEGQDRLPAVAVVVPRGTDGPHLIYRGEFFGAPIRNDADTVWMRERQVEALYRARFEERRYAQEALQGLYNSVTDVHVLDIGRRAWFVGVARPRLPDVLPSRIERDEARILFEKAGRAALAFAGRGGIHLLESVEPLNPRAGLRSWIAENRATGNADWRASWASVHHNGAVTVATAIGGQRRRDAAGQANGNQIDTDTLECSIADLMGLLQVASERIGSSEFEVQIGIEINDGTALVFETHAGGGSTYTSAVLARFTPITTSVRTDLGKREFYAAVHDLIADAVNQTGVREPRMIAHPERLA